MISVDTSVGALLDAHPDPVEFLAERGFAHETDEPGPGLVRIRIRRAPHA